MKKAGGINRRILNKKGMTLVEVIVAITLLLLGAQMIFVSVSFHARMNTKSRQIFYAAEKLDLNMQEEDLGESGVMRMDLDGAVISNDKDGRLYSEKISGGGESSLRAIWAQDSVMTDLFTVSGADAPTLRDRSIWNALPEEFPDLDMRIEAGKMSEVEEYCTSLDGEGGIIFNNEVSVESPSFSRLEGSIEVSAGGSYTGVGVTVLDTGEISLLADHISLRLGAEIYYFSGDMECRYSDKYRGKARIPIRFSLVPESGHGQPALVFVEDGVEIRFQCVSEDGAEVADSARENYTVEKGWYAIPADDGSDTASGAVDIFHLKAEDWDGFRLGSSAGKEESGELDKAYARLILAGLTDNGDGRGDE